MQRHVWEGTTSLYCTRLIADGGAIDLADMLRQIGAEKPVRITVEALEPPKDMFKSALRPFAEARKNAGGGVAEVQYEQD